MATAGGDTCLAWYHQPQGRWRDLAIVLCASLGHEAVSAYPTMAQLARFLAAAGFPVLRFDYAGTGDSPGDDHDPARLAAWRSSIDAAIAHARSLSGANEVALLGVRMGATLALDAALRLGTIRRLVLWAPVTRGRSFVRELVAGGTGSADGSLHVFGQHYSAETLESLRALDLESAMARAPAEGVLLVDRDDIPAQRGRFAQALQAAGAAVEQQAWPGFATMMRGSTQGVLDPSTLDGLAAWLAPAAPPRTDTVPLPSLAAPAWTSGDCRERLLQLGTGRLCGVLCEPAEPPAGARRPLVLLLNVGDSYRIGPHRLSVAMARDLVAQGERVLRLDFAGIGDSPPAPGTGGGQLYSSANVDDLVATMDALGDLGSHGFVLAGLCSGSCAAFRCALVDGRVRAVALMNTRLLEWTGALQADSLQDAPELHVRTLAAHLRAAARREFWQRLARREFDFRWLARRFRALVHASANRIAWMAGRGTPSLQARMEQLCRRGTDVLALVGEEDPGRGYMEYHFGRDGRALRRCPNFSMRYIADADHTFARPSNARQATAHLAQFLRTRAGAQAPPAGHPAASRIVLNP